MPDLMSPAAILEAAGSVDRPREAVLRQCRSELQRAGFQRPVVLAPDGRVISGLAKVFAAAELGLEAVPVQRLGSFTVARRERRGDAVPGLDMKAGALGVLGSLVWRPALYSRRDVCWIGARAWRIRTKRTDLAALRAAKAAMTGAVLDAAAADLVAVLGRLRGDWSDHRVAPVPCGNSGSAECFGKALARRVADALGAGFVQLWEDRPVSGSSHPVRSRNLADLVSLEPVDGPILVVDDVATSGAHLEQALAAIRAAGHPGVGAVWISGDVR